MKRTFVILLGIALLVPAVHASETRLLGMGQRDSLGMYPEMNWMVEDDYNIWLNPARLTGNANTIWTEIGTAAAGDEWGGASFKFKLGLDQTLGIFATRPYVGVANRTGWDPLGCDLTAVSVGGGPYTAVTGAPTIDNLATLVPANAVDLIYNVGLGKIALGLGVNYVSNTPPDTEYVYSTRIKANNDGSLKNSQSSSDLNISAGILLPKLGPITRSDVFASFGIPSVKNTYEERCWNAAANANETVDMELKSDNALNIAAGIRTISEMSEKLNIIGMFSYNSWKTPSKYTEKWDATANGVLNWDLSADRTWEQSLIVVGAAINLRPDEKMLMVIGTNLNLISAKYKGSEYENLTPYTEEYESESTWTYLPISLGAEYEATRLITLRGGIQVPVIDTRQDTKATDPTYGGTNTLVQTIENSGPAVAAQASAASCGVTFNIGKELKIDSVVGINNLFSGTWLLSGVAANPFVRIGAMYTF